MRVLVVDDDPVQVALITQLVEIFEVDHVSSGDEAFELFQHGHREGTPYQLMFMDLMMPGLDGYMLLEAIRSQESQQYLPKLYAIVISGKSVQTGMTEGLNDQCDDYLVKPVDSEMILRSLQNLALL